MSRSLHATLFSCVVAFPRLALAQAPAVVPTEPAPTAPAPSTVGTGEPIAAVAAPGAAPANEPSPAVAAPASVRPGEPVPTSNTPAATPSPAAEPQSMLSKFKVQFYGFTELDMIHDSTQSFNEL